MVHFSNIDALSMVSDPIFDSVLLSIDPIGWRLFRWWTLFSLILDWSGHTYLLFPCSSPDIDIYYLSGSFSNFDVDYSRCLLLILLAKFYLTIHYYWILDNWNLAFSSLNADDLIVLRDARWYQDYINILCGWRWEFWISSLRIPLLILQIIYWFTPSLKSLKHLS